MSLYLLYLFVNQFSVHALLLFRCDRILWLGKGIKQMSYDRAELRLSDHRPVRSTFVVEVEVFNQRKLQRALNFTSAEVFGDYFLDEPCHNL